MRQSTLSNNGNWTATQTENLVYGKQQAHPFEVVKLSLEVWISKNKKRYLAGTKEKQEVPLEGNEEWKCQELKGLVELHTFYIAFTFLSIHPNAYRAQINLFADTRFIWVTCSTFKVGGLS